MVVIDWSRKLAQKILWRAAKDMKPDNKLWLQTETCQNLCEQAGIDHAEYTQAMEYILARSDIQRALLLQNLKKNIGV